LNTSLLNLLRDDVELAFPASNASDQPSWKVLALSNPSAPVVSISRDPRAGPRIAPVLFAAAPSQEVLDSMAMGLNGGTQGRAPLSHQVKGKRLEHFMVVPAMYHMYSVSQFEEGVGAYLNRPQFNEAAWFKENCEVLIAHESKTFKAVASTEGVQVLSRPSGFVDTAVGDPKVTRGGLTGLDYAAEWPKELKKIHEFGPFTTEELTRLHSQTLEDYYYVTSWLLRENGEAEFKSIRDEVRGIFLRRLKAGQRLNPAADGSSRTSAS
jgi:hypothetical protein